MRHLKNKITSVLLLCFTIGLSSCKKEAEPLDSINNTISAIVADNFNLSIFSTGLRHTGVHNLTLEKGPFTVIAPSDVAFGLAGFHSSTSILSAEPARIAAIVNYHVIRGTYELNKLPFVFNQEIRSSNGGKLFATRWIRGQDTIVTLNGSRVLSHNIKATNGLIQVTNRVLEPYVHDRVTESVASDRNLSLFYQALKRSGVLETLDGPGAFTLFAPVNAAMVSYGLGTVEEINEKDPMLLKTLVEYHILTNRRFIYDYVLTSGTTTVSEQAMMDGNSVRATLIPDPLVPGDFKGITLRGTGNTSPANLIKQDVLSGNGVLHTIDAVLRITQ